MSKDIKRNINTNSAEFKQGVEAGLNSEEDTENWKAGNELGQELKDGSETVTESPSNESSIPVFMRDSREGNKGNAQDEKDEMGE